MTTDAQALKALKVLLEYYKVQADRDVLNAFFDGMVARLGNEVERLTREAHSAMTERAP